MAKPTWLYLYRLRNSNFWIATVTSTSTWIWRQLLALRVQVRPFFFHVIGNGEITNAWEDIWLDVGHLSRFISYRMVHAGGFSKASNVSEVLANIHHEWPRAWVERCSALQTHNIPSLSSGINDQVLWRHASNRLVPFTVSEVWASLLGHHQEVPWYKFCWFPITFRSTRFAYGWLCGNVFPPKIECLLGAKMVTLFFAPCVMFAMIAMTIFSLSALSRSRFGCSLKRIWLIPLW